MLTEFRKEIEEKTKSSQKAKWQSTEGRMDMIEKYNKGKKGWKCKRGKRTKTKGKRKPIDKVYQKSL